MGRLGIGPGTTVHTHTGTHRHSAECQAVHWWRAEAGSMGCSLLGTIPITPCLLVSLSVSSAGNQGPHPLWHPTLSICQSPRGQLQVQLSLTGIPATHWPLGHPVGELPQKGSFGAEMEGRQSVLKNHPQHPKKEISLQRDSLCGRQTSGHLSW